MLKRLRLDRPVINEGILLRPAIIVGVLFLAYYLGPRASVRMLVLPVAAVGALVLSRRPELGLVALLLGALSVPFSIGTGTQTSLNPAVLLPPALVVVWAVDMVRRKEVRLVPSPVNLPIVAFVVSATLSFIGGSIKWNLWADQASLRAQLGGWAVFAFSAATFLLVGNQVKEVRWLKVFTGIFLVVGGLYVAGLVLPFVGPITGRLVAEGSRGSLFWVWLVALAGGQALFNKGLSRTERLALLGLVALTLGVGWFGNRSWASGWAPPGLVLLTLLWLRSPRLGLLATVGAAVMFFWTRSPGSITGAMPVTAQVLNLLGLPQQDPNLAASLIAQDQYSVDTRVVAWDIVVTKVLPANPILGLGPSNYYHYTKLYPILGWYVNFNSHNQYVDILAQTGVLGLATFAWLMAAMGRLGWTLRERVGDGFARGYVYACLAGLVGSLAAGALGDWFLPFVYNIGLAGFRASILGWLFLGGLVALWRIGTSANRRGSE